MRNCIIVGLFVLIFVNFSFAQDIKKQENSTYKKAKIRLNTGELLQCMNLMLLDSTLVVTLSNSTQQVISLKDVNYIKVAKGNHALLGGFLGGALAFTVAMIINEFGDVTTRSTSTTTYTYDESGRHSSTSPTKTEIERTLSSGHILTMVAVGTLIGSVIGHTSISGWQQVQFNGVNGSGQPSHDQLNDKTTYHIQLQNGSMIDGIILGVSENWIYAAKRNNELIKIKIGSVREIYGKHHYKHTKEILKRADLKITDDVYHKAIEY